MSTDTATGLDLVAGTVSKTVTLADGRQITVTPLEMRQLKAFKAAAEPLADIAGRIIGAGVDNPADMLYLLDHEDELRAAVAIATEISAEELGRLNVEEFGLLVVAVMQVNVDFFTRRLLPRMAAAMSAVQSAGKLAQLQLDQQQAINGRTPSPR